jgi:2,4-dienoyl-CoA reductase-like NADH-dependent reductase (Old Yellow Enzyme family)
MLIECFVKDIIKIKDLGFDGVELHGAHGYLIDNFFWEGTNQRDDTYGGEIDKRTKFACEIIKRARKEIGRDFPIAIRFSQWKQQDYEAKIAHTPEELEKFLMPLVDAGVDVFHASNRRYWESEFEGSDLNLAGWTKKISGLPTITVGSVGLKSDFIGLYAGEDAVESAPIDELVNRLDAEEFDMVAVGRALLSDPEWVKKIKEERFDEIIPFESKFAQSVYY